MTEDMSMPNKASSPHAASPKSFVTAAALLTNAVGLHARPSVKLTQLAKSFGATVEIALALEGPWADAKSPVKVMRMKAPKGTMLHIRASGRDAAEAVEAMVALVEHRFGGQDEVAAGGSVHG
jgi:phosphocarrier protein HPr